jgi:hypothetical protein
VRYDSYNIRAEGTAKASAKKGRPNQRVRVDLLKPAVGKILDPPGKDMVGCRHHLVGLADEPPAVENHDLGIVVGLRDTTTSPAEDEFEFCQGFGKSGAQTGLPSLAGGSVTGLSATGAWDRAAAGDEVQSITVGFVPISKSGDQSGRYRVAYS